MVTSVTLVYQADGVGDRPTQGAFPAPTFHMLYPNSSNWIGNNTPPFTTLLGPNLCSLTRLQVLQMQSFPGSTCVVCPGQVGHAWCVQSGAPRPPRIQRRSGIRVAPRSPTGPSTTELWYWYSAGYTIFIFPTPCWFYFMYLYFLFPNSSTPVCWNDRGCLTGDSSPWHRDGTAVVKF